MKASAPLFAALALAPLAFAQEELHRWSHHRAITLNMDSAASVSGHVLRFPLLLRLPAGDSVYRQALAGGADVRFSKVDNLTIVPHEIESWDSAGATVWVLMDTVRAGVADPRIHMHWGRPGALSTSNGAAVFSAANGFRAVWHLNDSVNQTDASGQGNIGLASPVRPSATPDALIGGGKTFNGVSNWYQIGADTTFLKVDTDRGPYSISAWVRPSSCDARMAVLAKYANNSYIPGRHFSLHTANTTTTWRFTSNSRTAGNSDAAEFVADAPDACVPGAWAHLVATYRSGPPTLDSAVNARIYVNGALAATGWPASSTAESFGTAALAYIGRIATDERFMHGALDEVRLHSVARDSNWIRLERITQRRQANFVSFRDTTVPPPVAVKAWSAPDAGLRMRRLGDGWVFSLTGLGAGETAVLALVDLKGRALVSHRFRPADAGFHLASLPSGAYAARVTVLDARGDARTREYALSTLR